MSWRFGLWTRLHSIRLARLWLGFRCISVMSETVTCRPIQRLVFVPLFPESVLMNLGRLRKLEKKCKINSCRFSALSENVL